ncbi:acyl esterase, partial [Fusarium napiforme]
MLALSYVNRFCGYATLLKSVCLEVNTKLNNAWCQEYGYAILRVDERGIGNSDPFGLERSFEIQADAEGQDLYDVVEWAATQSWSNGKVAFSGISYYGTVGYWAAMQRPPHLTCVMSYELACSLYKAGRREGIYTHNFQSHWYNNIVIPQQRGARDGPRTKEELESDRVDYPGLLATNESLSDIEVPIYLAGNWTDSEVHLPGNIRAFNEVSSKEKWLEMHTGNHLGAFYEPDHIAMLRKYFLFDKKDKGCLTCHGSGYLSTMVPRPCAEKRRLPFRPQMQK